MLGNLFGGAANSGEQVSFIDAATLRQWFDAGDVIVIDAREDHEYASEHIPGALLNPLSRFDPAKVPVDPAKKLVVHCRSGNRCGPASAQLVQAGYNLPIYRLQGGIMAWAAAGNPLER